MTKVAAVLGAGIQGCCTAIVLSKLGFRVKLYDKSSAAMNRASSNQEGKIHLGFVYARDASMVTARKMIEHAMQFAPAIESFLGQTINWEPHLSRRFYCGIHRDSFLTLEEHYAHFKTLQSIYEEVVDDKRLHYLGRRPKQIWSDDAPVPFSSASLIQAVLTEETAVHPGWLRQLVVDEINSDHNIESFVKHDIDTVERVQQSFAITGKNGQGTWKAFADIVVNCLWEGKHRIDKAMHYNASDWITRVKYGFTFDSIPKLHNVPSLILTHGPFGDIVNFPEYRTIYLTWYPACLTYIGKTDQLPQQWEDACEGKHDPEVFNRILTETLAALSEYVPALSELELRQVMAGSIMGHGKTDISDRESGLHCRHGIGVDASDDYYTIFTGKFTSAPANAIELQRILS